MRIRTVPMVVVLAILATALTVYAGATGNLEPTNPPGSTSSYTLEDIYSRLDTGAAGAQSTFAEPGIGPGTGTMHTLNDVMVIAPKLNNRSGATAADVVSGKTYWGLTSGGWGLQTGTAAAKPDPPCFANDHRYVNCENGTVHDTVTNLLSLRDANCFLVEMDWTAANNAAAGLEDGECGLTDGSSPGDWRLPTKEEWEKTVERAVELGCTYQNAPSLVNKPGTKCFKEEWPAFNNVQSSQYWSSMTHPEFTFSAWYVTLYSGEIFGNIKTDDAYVWPVRDVK